MALKKSDLYSSLWASCDQLRGGMDASQYKDYVLFMLFIKYVSDKYADSDDLEPSVVVPKGASFRDMVALKGKPDIGDRVNTQIIAPLVEANERLGRNDFPNFNDPEKLGEGQALVDRLTNLIGIFEALDFSKNRADQDDILGDAYEYLMRHFATESGKSKGQFYTPAEVSRVIAKVIGIGPHNTVASTTAYDPTCGSGSLLLRIAAEAGKPITLEGQEKDVTTAGLARMNMILHDFPTANILSGDTLSSPKFKAGEQLRTYDYVVANPPFSDKGWQSGLIPDQDVYQRFAWGVPPKKQGDYAYLLHIVRSMKGAGRAACILPHGVLYRDKVEAVIRRRLVESGILKGIIGLPANLFYGTGIPACILVLDKENAVGRKGIFLIDASRGFIKDGNKNRLREQDIHRIVDTFRKQVDVPRYARMVPFEEIGDPKNDWNLNLPRYIDASEPEDLQDIDGHLRGGIPERDLDALEDYWQVLPGVRAALFESAGRSGYARLKVADAETRGAIFNHSEFRAFVVAVNQLFDRWKATNLPHLTGFDQDGHPKHLIELIAEDLLTTFRAAPLLDAYDVYQRLMDYWSETMQDDVYLVAADGWKTGAQPREIFKVKDKNNKLTWPEPHDYEVGKRRFKSDLIPAGLVVDRYFDAERKAIEALESDLSAIEQQLDELREEHAVEDGLLADVVEGEGDRQKITAKGIKARLKEIGGDPDYADEVKVLTDYAALLDAQADTKARLKAAQVELDGKLHAKYPVLTEAEVQTLVVEDKWLTALAAAVQGELDRVSQTLTGRIRQLADRYATPLPRLVAKVEELAARVDEHLRKMGAVLPGGRGDWTVRRLGDHAVFLKHGVNSRAELTIEGQVKYLHYGDIHGAKGVLLNPRVEPMPHLPPAKAERLDRLSTGDLVIADASEDLDGVGKSVELTEVGTLEVVSGLHTIAVRFDKQVLTDGYKAYLQHCAPFRAQLRRLAAGTKVFATNRSHVASVELALPDVEEQAAIATVLADIDAEIEALEARRIKTRDIKLAMMQELLTGRTRLV